MSDWRSRAKPVGSSWKDRARPVQEEPVEESPEQKGFLPDSFDSIPGWLYENAPIAPGVSFKDAVDRTAPVVQKIGEAVDPYTGAPTRAALSNAISGKNPVQGFKDAFGAEFGTAPSGKQIAQQLGVPDTSLSDVLPSLYSKSGEGLALEKGGLLDPTASGSAGFGLDVATDWTNVVPVGLIANTAGKLGKAGAKTGLSIAKSAPVVGGVVEGGKDAAKTFTQAVSKVVSPRQSAGFPAAVDVAKRHGIDPNILPPSVEFGPSSFISRASRVVAEGPAGETLLSQYKSADDAVGAAIEASVAKAAKGKPLDLVTGGSAIKEGYDSAKNALLGGADITYDKIQKYAPGLYIDRDAAAKLNSTLNGIEKYAKGRLADRGATADVRQQGKLLLANVAAIRKGNGSLKQTVEALKDIGQKAFANRPSVGVIPHDTKKMGDMYFAMRDAIVDTARKHISPEMADELVANNSKISDFLKNSSEFEKFLDLPPEKIVPAIAADTKRLGAFKATVGPEVFSQLKGAYVQDLIPKNANGDVLFGSLVKKIRNDDAVLKSLLEPGEYSALKELSELGASFGPSVMSSSGTGASSGFLKMIDGIFDSTVTKKTVDAMKSRARKLGVDAPTPMKRKPVKPTTPPVDKPRPGLVPRMTGKRRGLIGQTIKGSQSLAPSGLLVGDDEQ